jgi:hypothetical protein
MEVGPSPSKIGLRCQMLLGDSRQPTMTSDQYHQRLVLDLGVLFNFWLQLVPQSKVVLNVGHIIRSFLFQMVSLLGVYTLKNTPIAFTPKSTTRMAQYLNCKLSQIKALATKLLPPIRCSIS